MSQDSKKYYVLLVLELKKWSVQFGDYVYGNVLSERDDYLDHQYKMKHLHILTVESDLQADIDAAVKRFNEDRGL